jgi:hypothetical protein
MPPPEPEAGPAARRRADRVRRRLLVLRPATAFACGLALLAGGVTVGAALESGSSSCGAGTRAGGGPPVTSLTLHPVTAGTSSAIGTARLLPRQAWLEVSVRGVRPSTPGTFYQLWLMNSPGDLVALASFRVPASGAMTMEVPLPVSPHAYHFVDISLQPATGSPRHSADSVLRGPIS